jgi:hypothetical protein
MHALEIALGMAISADPTESDPISDPNGADFFGFFSNIGADLDLLLKKNSDIGAEADFLRISVGGGFFADMDRISDPKNPKPTRSAPELRNPNTLYK